MPGQSDQFRRDGFVVLPGEIHVKPLAEEFDQLVDEAFSEGRGALQHLEQGTGTVTFRYAPMMCEHTPSSMILLDHFAPIAAELVGRAVLPGRAKGTWYQADTGWHRDSRHDIPSIGVVAYLEPLDDSSGALRVLPGSHVRPDQPLPDPGALVGTALATTPGDVIVFDERLIHGSRGGRLRRQWRWTSSSIRRTRPKKTRYGRGSPRASRASGRIPGTTPRATRVTVPSGAIGTARGRGASGISVSTTSRPADPTAGSEVRLAVGVDVMTTERVGGISRGDHRLRRVAGRAQQVGPSVTSNLTADPPKRPRSRHAAAQGGAPTGEA